MCVCVSEDKITTIKCPYFWYEWIWKKFYIEVIIKQEIQPSLWIFHFANYNWGKLQNCESFVLSKTWQMVFPAVTELLMTKDFLFWF